MNWWKLLAWLAVIYATLCALVWVFQSKLIWMPIGTPGPVPTVLVGSQVEECWLTTDDGLRLHAWWIHRDDAQGCAVVSHGNAGNIEHRLSLARGLVRAGLNVLLYDYRGFGHSEGSPDEAGTYLDAEAAWRFVVDERQQGPRRLLAYGESLGGAVAVELASRRECGALVIESSFTTLPDMAAAAYPFLPARWLCRSRYASVEKIGALELPILIAHSPDDEIVPFSQGQALFAAAPEPKTFLETEQGHNDGGLMAMAGGSERLRAWLDDVWGDGDG